jgi:hypothetical protein
MDRPNGVKFLSRAFFFSFTFCCHLKTDFGFALPLLLGGREGYFSWSTVVEG